MRTGLTLFTAGLLAGAVSAQGVITRMNAGTSEFYYDGNIQAVLDEAFEEAGTDTILLGGGTYNMTSDILISSPVVMIGTGIHPDSSLAYNNNGRTEIAGGQFMEWFLENDASGSEFHGIAFTNEVDVQFGTGPIESTDVNDVKFFRCEFQGLGLGNGQFGSMANDTYIHECVFRGGFSNGEAQGSIIRNSAIKQVYDILNGNDCLFENCIFFSSIGGGSGVQYENNVFLLNQGSNYNINQQSTYLNNLFVGTGAGFGVTFGVGVVANGNEFDYPLNGANGAFPSATVTDWNNFDFYADYHLATAWSGFDFGLFGGGDPWKEGSVPFNPHWRELTTPTGTENGTLQGVTIKASAQQD
ncbi:MAG TPA: glycosyl hydrolase family 28-related protein [Flavobacteriales bacterium]|nr:glycoside hydrolase family 55 protein [Flavobacteriales bacterium]MCC6542682.1 hypothetical protein [Flavobacteriales bacterium]HMU14134.1 glycosyl hydrolase family 28-related protein [Flavobacteriales bacterium]HMW96582.1 glycosyl hydrolase family 28-related protein [Flavobacteriales bacterium]HMZ48838.1 glycosyl hydrolase family 28-related protein [Flavobacteriales bacterium]